MARERINSLQGLRALAFIAIFLSHSGFMPFDSSGRWGVSIFFMLSGFVMTYNYYDREITENSFKFTYSKIKKLYSLHIVTMICCIPLVLIRIMQGHNTFFNLGFNILLNALLIQEWFPNLTYYCALNQVAWYLCACTFHYFCFPTILKCIKKWKSKKVAIFTIIILCLICVGVSFIGSRFDTFEIVKWFTYNFPIARLIDFVIGCSLGYVFLTNKDRYQINTVLSTVLELVTILLIVLSIYISLKEVTILGQSYTRYSLLFIPTSMLFIYLIASSKGFVAKLLETKLMVTIGNLSSFTFLIHQFLFRYIKAINTVLFSDKIPLIVIFIVTLILTYALTFLWIKITKSIKAKSQKKIVNQQ